MTASDDAGKAIVAALDDPWGTEAWDLTNDGLADLALAAMMPDGRTVAQWLNAVPDLLAIARWAQDAPHHDGCTGHPARPRPCTCGRDEVMGRG